MKNYTITVNGNVYDVVVEEGASTGAPVAAKAPAAPKACLLYTSYHLLWHGTDRCQPQEIFPGEPVSDHCIVRALRTGI